MLRFQSRQRHGRNRDLRLHLPASRRQRERAARPLVITKITVLGIRRPEERALRHGDNPVLNMCAANAVVTRDPAGNRKLDKAKSYSKIDGMVALTMALGCMSADTVQYSSPWDNPDYRMAV